MVVITISLSVSSSVSSSVLTKPTSSSTGICRVNNLYQEPISEDYYCKEEERSDSERENEDDGWPGTGNHWCPLSNLTYHYFIGPSPLGFMEQMDLVSISATCQFAMFIASVSVRPLRNMCGEIENIDLILNKLDSFNQEEWISDQRTYGVTCHHFQHNKNSEGMRYLRWKILQQWRDPWLSKT